MKTDEITVTVITDKTMKNSFLTTLIWSSSDEDGEPYDNDYCISDIENHQIVDDIINRFILAVESDPILISIDNITELTGNDSDRIMHDLCLTINHHGAGFWDGDYSPDAIESGIIGDLLTAISHQFNEIYLFENDGKLTIENC